MNNKKIKKIYNNLMLVVLAALFMYSSYLLYQSYSTGNVQFFFGYKPVIVQTDVMAPEINKNDIVIVKKQDIKHAKVGEIAYFEVAKNVRTIERISNIREDGTIRTKKNTESKNSLMVITDKEYLGVGLFAIQISYLIKNPIVSVLGLITLALGLYIVSYFVKDAKMKKGGTFDGKSKTMDK